MKQLFLNKPFLISFPFLLFFFSFNAGPVNDYYHPKWIFLTGFSMIPVFIFLKKQFSLIMAVVGTYMLLAGLMPAINKYWFYEIVHDGFRYEMIKSFVFLICSFLFSRIFFLRNINKELAFIHVINCFYTLSAAFFGFYIQGFGANVSVNATLLAMTFPFTLSVFTKRWQVISFIITLIAILTTKATMGLMAFIGSSIFYLFITGKCNLKSALKLIPALLILLAFGRVVLGEKIYSTSGRMECWQIMKEYASRNNSWIFGAGLGSFAYVVPEIQRRLKINELLKNKENINLIKKHRASKGKDEEIKNELLKKSRYRAFPWAHSDIFQLIFDVGIFGTILVLIGFIEIFKKGFEFNNFYLLTFFTSYIINCIGNFPSHLAVEAFLVFYAINKTYQKREA